MFHRRLLICAFLLAVVVRLWLVSAFAGSEITIADAQDYNRLAKGLVTEGAYLTASGQPSSLRPPLYPAVVAGVYWLFGTENHTAVRLLQGGFGILLGLVTLLLGRLLYSKEVGVASCVIVWLYPTFIGFENQILSETLFTLLLTGGLTTVVLALQRHNVWWLGAAGLLLGLGALTRSILWLYAPVLSVFLFLAWGKRVFRDDPLAWTRGRGQGEGAESEGGTNAGAQSESVEDVVGPAGLLTRETPSSALRAPSPPQRGRRDSDLRAPSPPERGGRDGDGGTEVAGRLSGIGRRLLAAGVPLVVFVLTLAPWAIRNTMVQKTFTVIDVMGGRNVMMGNYEYTPLERSWATVDLMRGEREWIRVLADQHGKLRGLTQGQIDKLAMKYGLSFMLQNPGLTLQRCAVKFFNFWQLEREFVAGMVSGHFGVRPRWQIGLAALLIFGSYILTIFGACFGGWLHPTEDRRVQWLWLLTIAFLCGVHTMAFAHSRYHLPVIPLLAIWASTVLTDWSWLRQWRTWRFHMGLAMCLFLTAGWAREIICVDLARTSELMK